jgi:glutamine---fructose-6-phosphate transaminase (isomerizing)
VCAIVGYTGQRPCRALLLDGLSRLEYRGLRLGGHRALATPGGVETVRTVGNVRALRAALGVDQPRNLAKTVTVE